MTDPRSPSEGELQIVVLLGDAAFIAWAPAHAADGLMDSFERRAGIAPHDRGSREVHASLRMRVARDLRGPEAEKLFTDVLAAACLWLSLRHWSNGTDMARGLEQQMREKGRAVITASIADPAPAGMMADTAWSFMIGDRIHDGREQIASATPGGVQLVTRD